MGSGRIILVIKALLLLTPFVFGGRKQAPKLSKHPILLVVSFDGFRADYMTKTETPNLKALQDEGVRVPFMKAQFPTKTFPNHQSIATGLYPESHGITDNTLFDPNFGKVLSGFNDDPEFWNYSDDVLPFWIRNEQAGDDRYSGCFLWAGSSQGYGTNSTLYPTYYIPQYDSTISWETRVSAAVSWIINDEKPANMVFLYHDEPDTQGHAFGTDDEETLSEIRTVDERAGYLIQALKNADIYDKINLIILSDHGMQTLHRDNVINTTAMVDTESFTNYGGTPIYQISPKNSSDLDSIYESFKNGSQGENFTAFKKEELSIFNYGNNRRIMEIILLVDPGYGFEDMTRFNDKGVRGIHGYDNNAESMYAFFIARGPVFKKNYNATNPINNIDLVPLFSKIMGVLNVPHNGSLDNISEILVNDEDGKTTTGQTSDPSTTVSGPTSDTTSDDGNGGSVSLPNYHIWILLLLPIFILPTKL